MNTQDREEFVLLKADVEHIKEDVKETKIAVTEINDKFTKLAFHLTGDKDVGKKGLIEDFSGLKVRVSTLEKVYATVAGLITVVIIWGEKLVKFFFEQ